MTIFPIAELWNSSDPRIWNEALERYWSLIKPTNLELERQMENLREERISGFDERAWYKFLRDDYFRWKYTAANRYASTTKSLRRYEAEGKLTELHQIKAHKPLDISAQFP